LIFAGQASLNTGSVLEGIKNYWINSFRYCGNDVSRKTVGRFMDGRPLNISTTELNAFRRECRQMRSKKSNITQPGAEFPATSGERF
jgi:hypothetical protein